METEARQPDPALIRSLLEAGHRFSFFRAVQLLELCHPDAAPLGTGGPARDEVVRLRPDPSFTVPRASISKIEEVPRDDGGRRFLVTQTILGLYGLRSPMPEVYAEEILKRQEEDDPVRDFLDLFHHRMMSLLYRAWVRSRSHVSFRQGGSDPLTRIVFAAGGFSEEPVRGATGLPALGLLRYTQYFSRPAKTAEGLAGILSDALGGAAVRVEPYMPRTVSIPEEQQARLGRSGCTLGVDFSAGDQVPDRSGKFRLAIGPLERPLYLALAPGGTDRALAGALVRLYLLDPLEHDTLLGILAAAKPPFRLGAEQGAPRLGIDTWLHTESPEDSWIPFPGFPAPNAAAPSASPAAGPEERAA